MYAYMFAPVLNLSMDLLIIINTINNNLLISIYWYLKIDALSYFINNNRLSKCGS